MAELDELKRLILQKFNISPIETSNKTVTVGKGKNQTTIQNGLTIDGIDQGRAFVNWIDSVLQEGIKITEDDAKSLSQEAERVREISTKKIKSYSKSAEKQADKLAALNTSVDSTLKKIEQASKDTTPDTVYTPVRERYKTINKLVSEYNELVAAAETLRDRKEKTAQSSTVDSYQLANIAKAEAALNVKQQELQKILLGLESIEQPTLESKKEKVYSKTLMPGTSTDSRLIQERRKAKSKMQLLKNRGAIKNDTARAGWDIETSGVGLNDMATTFAFVVQENEQILDSIDIFLAQADVNKKGEVGKKATIDNLLKSMNITENNEAIESSRQIRDRIGKMIGRTLGSKGKVSLTAEEADLLWNKIERQIVTPSQLAGQILEVAKKYNLKPSEVVGYNINAFDKEFMKRWALSFGDKESKQLLELLDSTGILGGSRDTLENINNYLTGRFGFKFAEPGKIKGVTTLQHFVEIKRGKQSEGQHDAASDSLDTILTDQWLNTTMALEGLGDFIEQYVNQTVPESERYLDDKKTYSEKAKMAARVAMKNFTIGMGVTDFSDDSLKAQENEIESKMIRGSNARQQAQAIVNMFDQAQKESLSGNELRQRYRTRSGQNVDSVTGGNGTLGSSQYAIERIITEANSAGYQVIARRVDDDEIQFMLISNDDFNPNGDYDWEDKNALKFSAAVAANGRIGNKINDVYGTTEFDTAGGAHVRLETAETMALNAIADSLHFLKQNKEQGRTDAEIGQSLTRAGRKVINSTVSSELGLGDEEKITDTFTGPLGVREARESVSYSRIPLIKAALKNKQFNSQLTDWWKAHKSDSEYELDNLSTNPQVIEALNDAILYYLTENEEDIVKKASAMGNDQLLKEILTNDEILPWLKAQVAELGRIVKTDQTGISENRNKQGRIGTASSNQYDPFGNITDPQQRSITQRDNGKSLTASAMNLRRGSTMDGGARAPVLQTQLKIDSGVDEQTKDFTYQFEAVDKEQFAQWQREFLRAQGKNAEEIERLIVDLEDRAIISEELKQQTQSLQEKSSGLTRLDAINREFFNGLALLDQNGQNVSIDDVLAGKYKAGSEFSITREDGSIAIAEQYKGFSEKFAVAENDIIASLRVTQDGAILATNKIKEIEQSSEMVIGQQRVTLEDNPELFSWLKTTGKIKQETQGIYSREDELTIRNIYSYLNGQVEAILLAAKEQEKTSDEIVSIIEQAGEAGKFLSRMIKSVDGRLIYAVTDTKEGMLLDKNGNQLLKTDKDIKDFVSMASGAGLRKIGEALLGKQEYDKIAETRREAIVQKGVYSWEDASGYASPSELENIGRVHNDWKVRAAHERSRGFAQASVISQSPSSATMQQQLSDAERLADSQYGDRAKRANELIQELRKQNESLRSTYNAGLNEKNIEIVHAENFVDAEHQINLDDEQLRVNFKNAIERGEVAEADYEEFVMEQARILRSKAAEADAAYKKAGILLKTTVDGVEKTIYLADERPTQQSNGYYLSRTDKINAKLLSAAQTRDNEYFKDVIHESTKLTRQLAESKDSTIVRDAYSSFMPYSAFSLAQKSGKIDSTLTPEAQAELLNTAFMSSGRLRQMYSTGQGASISSLKKNILNLAKQYGIRTNPDKYNGVTEKSLNKKSEIELRDLEQQIVSDIIIAISKGDVYTTDIGRYPYTQGMEGHIMRIGIDERAGNGVRLSAGMLAALKGDTDGDHLRVANRIFDATNFTKDVYNAELERLRLYDQVAFSLEELQPKGGSARSQQKELKQLEDIANKLSNREELLKASGMAKNAFAKIGTLSTTNTNFRTALDRLQVTGHYGTLDQLTNDVQGGILRSLFETFEQEAISSKKAQAHIYKQSRAGLIQEYKKNSGVTRIDQIPKDVLDQIELQASAQAYDTVGRLADMLRSGDIKGAIAQGINTGIFKGNEITKQLMPLMSAYMGHLRGGSFSNIAGLSSDPTKAFKQLFGFDYYDAKSGNISMQQVFENAADRVESQIGGVTFGQMATFDYKVNQFKKYDQMQRERSQKARLPKPMKKPKEIQSHVKAQEVTQQMQTNSAIGVDGNANIVVGGNVVVTGANISMVGDQGGAQPSASANKYQPPVTIPTDTAIKAGKYTPLEVINAPGYEENHKRLVGPDGSIPNTSLTTLLSGPEVKNFFSNNTAAATGTFAHAVAQKLIEGKTLNVDKVDVKKERDILSGYGPNGVGKILEQDIVQLEERAQSAVKSIFRNFGDEFSKAKLGKDYLTEYTMAGLFENGTQAVTGQLDLFKGGNVYDWKFSQHGGENDPTTMFERIFQESSYLRMLEEEAQHFVANATDKRTAEYKKYNNILKLIQENGNVITGRNFKAKDGQYYTHEISTKALASDFIKNVLAQLAEGRTLNYADLQKEIEANAQVQHRYFDKNGNEVTDAKTLEMLRGSGSVSNKDSTTTKNQIISQTSQIFKAEEDLERVLLQKKKAGSAELPWLEKEEQAIREKIRLQTEYLEKLKQGNLTEQDRAELERRTMELQLNHNKNMAAINASAKQTQGFLQKLIGGFKQQIQFLIDRSLAYSAVGKIRQIFQTLISTTKQLDQALVNIQIATGNTRVETREMLKQYSDLATELGRTTQEVAAASNDWLRAGYEGKEAAELTKASMMLSTLGMIDSAEATKYLISTLKGWKLQADEVINVVDKLSAVD